MNRWLIIDVSNWAYRLLYACGPGERSLRMFFRWAEVCEQATQPHRVVLCYDTDGPSFRHQIAGDYKAGRRDEPIGLPELINRIRQQAIENAWDNLSADGFEADDCIATVTDLALASDGQVIVCSSDKDLFQLLIEGRVIIIRDVSVKTGVTWYNASDLHADQSLHPHQWSDYLTLVGDSVDNVSGCDGIGEKTARQLLVSAGSIDNHFRSPFRGGLSDRHRARLSGWKKSGGLDRTRQLIHLRNDVPLPDGWEPAT
ncbi:5'-3' exonuclease [Roseiconus lacunae]|uniref:5'-3' exonuclease n=1 Tax=Roseiconus lacunae TaxID=2605694 RepID=UPI0011F1A63D|nr:5'-3' exonuclease H3TH domain-containing protein [Roseiconus lacunae]